MPPDPRRRLPRILLAVLIASAMQQLAPAPAQAVGSRVLSFADDNTHGELGNGSADVGQTSPIELDGMADIVAVSSGVFHNLALRSDGRVLAWGDNSYGQLGDGTVQERHVPTLVPGLSHVVGIKAGGYFSVALRSDGSVWHWGRRAGQTPATNLPKLLTPERVPDLAGATLGAGVLHRLVGQDDGTAVAFGYNEHGQLGDGTTTDRWPPAPMAGASGVAEVAGGGGHSAVLLDDGTVLTTGLNDHGQLGDGTNTPRETLAPVPDLEATSIAVGDMHALALLGDGTVVSWGYGGVGQLGYVFADPPPDRLVPGPVPGVTGVTAIRAGDFSSGAINADGAWTWGWSTGVAGKEAWAVPIFVDGTEGATDLSLGMHHGLFLIDGVPLDLPDPVETTMTVAVETEPAYVGAPVTFTVTVDPAPDMGSIEMGADPTGTLETAEIDPATGGAMFTESFDSAGNQTRYFRFQGVPGFQPSSSSRSVTVAEPPTTVVGSRLLSFAYSNPYGQLGNGTADVGQSSPIELEGMSDIVTVSSGGNHNLALRSDGRVLAWGDNRSGQLGDGTTVERPVPTLVPGLTHVVAIEAGGSFSLAMRSDGSVWQWGARATETPATALPSLLSPTRVDGVDGQALGAGVGHRVIATADGAAIGFGYNGFGQLGDDTTVDRWPPAPMLGVTGVVGTGGGYGYSVVLTEDGTVWTTGQNDNGQLGDGTTASRRTLATIPDLAARSIAVGDRHALGLLDDGTVVSWGYGAAGQLGYSLADTPPDRLQPGPVPGLTGVTAIRAGNFSSGAINADGAWTWGWSTGAPGSQITLVPTLIEGTEGATDMSLGFEHGLFLIDGVPLDLPDPLETSLTVEQAEPVYVGEPVTFTVTIDPAPDMGTVSMGDGPSTTTQTAELDPATGTATFTETFESAGDRTRYFRFDGVPGFEASSSSIDLTVGRRSTAVAIAGASTRTIGREQVLTIDATVTPATGGGVQVFDVTGTPVALGDPVTVDAADGAATLTVGPLDLGTYQVEVRYLGSSSHLPSTSSTIHVTVVEGPVAGAPVVRVGSGKKAGQGSIPVTVSWANAPGVIDHYEMQTRIDGGAWTTVATNLTKPSVARTLVVSRNHEFRARAVDAAGHVGPWVASTPFRARLSENTSSSVWYRGTWSPTVRATGYSGGSARPTSARAARATLTFAGTGVTWLATVGPTRGRIRVYIDSVHVKTIDLRAAASDTRRIVFTKHWSTPGRHTITLYNEATSGRPRVDLDAFVMWTGP